MAESGVSEYLFFAFDQKVAPHGEQEDMGDLQIQVFTPSWNKLRINKFTSIWLYLFWYWFSSQKYYIYFVTAQDEVVHISHVLSQTPRFAFMEKFDWEIGPCWTHPDHRGQGIYSRVLKKISRELGNRQGRLLIFAEKENSASLNGIAKAGFVFLGSGKKTGPWGIYRITESDQSD